MPFLKVVFKALVFGVSCGFWSLLGMMATAVFSNKYVAICVPISANFVFERVTRVCPGVFNLKAIALSYLTREHVAEPFLYSIGVYVLLGVIFTFLFAFFVKRRVQNEIT